jgi:hypothetical protein
MATDDVTAALDRAHEIQKQVDALYAEQDALLDPIYAAAIARNDLAELQQLYHRLPRGLHRTELRTYLINLDGANHAGRGEGK